MSFITAVVQRTTPISALSIVNWKHDEYGVPRMRKMYSLTTSTAYAYVLLLPVAAKSSQHGRMSLKKTKRVMNLMSNEWIFSIPFSCFFHSADIFTCIWIMSHRGVIRPVALSDYAHRDVTAEVRPSLCDIQTTFSQTLLSFYYVMLLSIVCPNTWVLANSHRFHWLRILTLYSLRLRLRWHYNSEPLVPQCRSRL